MRSPLPCRATSAASGRKVLLGYLFWLATGSRASHIAQWASLQVYATYVLTKPLEHLSKPHPRRPPPDLKDRVSYRSGSTALEKDRISYPAGSFRPGPDLDPEDLKSQNLENAPKIHKWFVDS